MAQVVLIALKLAGVIGWSWWWVFASAAGLTESHDGSTPITTRED